jgi:hypothetical protein
LLVAVPRRRAWPRSIGRGHATVASRWIDRTRRITGRRTIRIGRGRGRKIRRRIVCAGRRRIWIVRATGRRIVRTTRRGSARVWTAW